MDQSRRSTHPDYRIRRSKVSADVRSHGAQAMLVTDLDNVFFLSGFTGSNGALAILVDGSATLVTDARYRDQALEECRDTKVIIDRAANRRALHMAAETAPGGGNVLSQNSRHSESQKADGSDVSNGVDDTGLARDTGPSTAVRPTSEARLTPDIGLTPDAPLASDAVPEAGMQRVAFEADHLSVSAWRDILGEVGGASLIPTSGLVEGQRRSKESVEVELIESACLIAESALLRTVADVRTGMSEREIARALDNAMLEGGADGIAFETIVASGPNSAIPHHSPTTREVDVGDLLKIDFGARLGRYHSDITRTFIVGSDPSREQIRWHRAVERAAAAARESLAAGVPASKPYRSAYDVLAEEGLADAFTHGLGHGVGLVIHEAPIMTAGCDGTLVAGDVLTVEPGVYFPGVGGVRIEDTLVVTDTGSRSLTTIPRGLVRLG